MISTPQSTQQSTTKSTTQPLNKSHTGSTRYGDAFSGTFAFIYSGVHGNYSDCIKRVILMLTQFVDTGLISMRTKNRIEKLLTDGIELENLDIKSRNSSHIILVNRETNEEDTFELEELIDWIYEQIYNDPIMRKLLNDENGAAKQIAPIIETTTKKTLEMTTENPSALTNKITLPSSVKERINNIFNTYTDVLYRTRDKKNLIDVHIYENEAIFTRLEECGEIRIYSEQLSDQGLPFEEVLRLTNDNLTDGKMYLQHDNIFVNTTDGNITKIVVLEKVKYVCSKISGRIIAQLKDESLIYEDDGKIMCLDVLGKKSVLIKNILPETINLDSDDIYWENIYKNSNKDKK